MTTLLHAKRTSQIVSFLMVIGIAFENSGHVENSATTKEGHFLLMTPLLDFTLKENPVLAISQQGAHGEGQSRVMMHFGGIRERSIPTFFGYFSAVNLPRIMKRSS